MKISKNLLKSKELKIKVAIGSDHAGFVYKSKISDFLKSINCEVIDEGAQDSMSSDYPDFAFNCAKTVASGKAQLGILICGTGIGMCIAANKVKGIRAAVCWNTETAKLSREHNNANILCLGARLLTIDECISITKTFIYTQPINEEKYLRRIGKIKKIEGERGSIGK